MALSTDEKSLTRQAICAGAFNASTPPLQGVGSAVDASVMDAVSAMADEQVRQVLRAFQLAQTAALQSQLASAEAQAAAIQAKITALQAIAVAPPPASSAGAAAS